MPRLSIILFLFPAFLGKLYAQLPDPILDASYLQGKNESYLPHYVLDEDLKTWWTPDTPFRSGRHARLKMKFDEAVTIAGFKIRNGSAHPNYPGYGNLYKLNNRMGHGQLILANPTDTMVVNFELEDRDQEQYLALPNFTGTNYVELQIVSVYPGSKWNDLGLSQFKPVSEVPEDATLATVHEILRVKETSANSANDGFSVRQEQHLQTHEYGERFSWAKLQMSYDGRKIPDFIFNSRIAFQDFAGIDPATDLVELVHDEDGAAFYFSMPELWYYQDWDQRMIVRISYGIDGTCAGGYSLLWISKNGELTDAMSFSGTCSEPEIVDGKFVYDDYILDLKTGDSDDFGPSGSGDLIGGEWVGDEFYALFYKSIPGGDNIFLFRWPDKTLVESYECDCFEYGMYECAWSEYDAKTGIWKLGSQSEEKYRIIDVSKPSVVRIEDW